jgi:energy-converting hydrogenase Eha subunit H
MSSQPYIPDALPLRNLDYQLLLPLVGQPNAALARNSSRENFVESVFDYGLHKVICGVLTLRKIRLPS